MYHFFVEENQIDREAHKVRIEGSDYNHIRNVLRMRAGEEVSVSCGDECEYRCEIAEYEEDAVLCNLLFVKSADVESPVYSVLYQGIPKGDKMETIIQKCVELGVSEIVPVSMTRCVVKLDEKKAAAKVARWQAIAEAAAKQSKRAIIPEVKMPMSMKEAYKDAGSAGVSMIPYELAEGMEKTREIFARIQKLVATSGVAADGTAAGSTAATPGEKGRVAIFIGPEGGFTEEEIAQAMEAGIEPVSLGKRILRTETAGMAVLAWLNYCLEVEI